MVSHCTTILKQWPPSLSHPLQAVGPLGIGRQTSESFDHKTPASATAPEDQDLTSSPSTSFCVALGEPSPSTPTSLSESVFFPMHQAIAACVLEPGTRFPLLESKCSFSHLLSRDHSLAGNPLTAQPNEHLSSQPP